METEKFYKRATDENYKKPIKIFDISCERGIYETCYVVGAIDQNSLKDDKAAKKYYKNACELKGKIADEDVERCSKF